jgi:hypothetical protein
MKMMMSAKLYRSSMRGLPQKMIMILIIFLDAAWAEPVLTKTLPLLLES